MVRYSEELIEEIRANNDIVDVVSQYVILKRSGRNFFGLCPFHKEKSPSFSVSSATYTEVCTAIIEICQYYDAWEKDLHEMIWEGKSFQDLIDRSEDIFRNPVFISNWQGNVLGYSKSYKESDIRPFWYTVTHENRVPLDTLAILMDSEYRKFLKEEIIWQHQ